MTYSTATCSPNGHQTNYAIVGKGPRAAVLLHGWGGSIQSFIETGLAEQIADGVSGSVICVDVPGFGDSQLLPEQGWSSFDFAQWLNAFLVEIAATDLPLIGHSNGGRIILRYVLEYKSSVPIVLIAASGVQWPLSKRQQCVKKASNIFKVVKPIIPKKVLQWVQKKVFKAHDWANADLGQKATLAKLSTEPCMRDQFSMISQRALLLWGHHDTMTPMRSGQVLKERLPNARMVTFSDGRHGIHRTHTDAVGMSIIAFLK